MHTQACKIIIVVSFIPTWLLLLTQLTFGKLYTLYTLIHFMHNKWQTGVQPYHNIVILPCGCCFCTRCTILFCKYIKCTQSYANDTIIIIIAICHFVWHVMYKDSNILWQKADSESTLIFVTKDISQIKWRMLQGYWST